MQLIKILKFYFLNVSICEFKTLRSHYYILNLILLYFKGEKYKINSLKFPKNLCRIIRALYSKNIKSKSLWSWVLDKSLTYSFCFFLYKNRVIIPIWIKSKRFWVYQNFKTTWKCSKNSKCLKMLWYFKCLKFNVIWNINIY